MQQSQLALSTAETPDVKTLDLMDQLEQANELLDILATSAAWASAPGAFAWLMLPVIDGESEVYVASTHKLPKENIRALMEDFLYSVGGTASAYGASLPDPDIIGIHERVIDEQAEWELAVRTFTHDVGLVTRGKLRAVVRVCAAGDNSPAVVPVAERVARIMAPYVDAALLSRSVETRAIIQQPEPVLSCKEFANALNEHVSRLRQRPAEFGLLRLRMRPRDKVADTGDIEHAMMLAKALVENSVRRGDVVGMIRNMDIGVMMLETGPRKALIAAMRIADEMAQTPPIANVLDAFIGVSGWSISGSDAEGLLFETDLAVSQAQCSTHGNVQLHP